MEYRSTRNRGVIGTKLYKEYRSTRNKGVIGTKLYKEYRSNRDKDVLKIQKNNRNGGLV